MLHTLNKNFLVAALFCAAATVATASNTNTYADTSATADGSATVTFHVLESGATEESPENSTATADDDPEAYVDDDSSSEESTEIPQNEDLPDDGDESFIDDDTLNIAEDPASTSGDNTSASTGTTADSSDDNIATPDTGAGAGSAAPESDFNIFPIFAIVGGLLLLALIVKSVKDERANRLYRGPRHSTDLRLSSFAHLRFSHDHSRRLNLVRIVRLTTVAGVAVFACVFFLNGNTPDDTEAASSYPYTISLQNGANYDIYVKQGESAQAAFAVKTTTDNPTGYTLSMTADQQTLAAADGTIAPANADTTLSNLTDNTWGFSTSGTTYSAVPTTHSTGATLRKTSGASASGNSSVVYFGVKAGTELPAGDYTTTIRFSARTNLVTKKLKFANGNVATVTRVSDGSALSNKAEIYVGEELKINNATDHSGILQTASVNGTTVSNGATVTVTDATTVSTSDDSMHFIKNTYDTAALADGTHSANGDAILIKSQGKVWLVDAGKPTSVDGALNGETVANYLKSLGISKIDYFLVTHIHSDHYGGATYLKNQGYIDKNTTIYLRGCKATDNAKHESACNELVDQFDTVNAQVIKLYAQESVRASLYSQGLDFGNFHIDFYNIEKSGDHIAYNTNRENFNSIGTKWTHKPSGKTAFLAADWEWGVEATYASKIGKVDILKAGHHGGKTSNTYEFYSTLLPKTVIVTAQDFASAKGLSQRQEAAWAYVQQKGGAVYFTGSSTGDAVALSFNDSGYSVKKGKKKDVIADANTADDPVSYDGGNTYFKWAGGVTKWYYPTNKTGAAPYNTTNIQHFVYVRQSLSSTGNTILQVDRCVDGLMYRFSTDHGDGVADNSQLKTCS